MNARSSRAPRPAGLAPWRLFLAARYGRRMRIAACSCGRLKVSCEGEPVRISMCHCLACQRRTGSVFSVQARWPADRVTIEGPVHEYDRVGDEGSKATFRFCPTCGATVYWDSDGMPGLIAVPVGAFADPVFPPPRSSSSGESEDEFAGSPGSCRRLFVVTGGAARPRNGVTCSAWTARVAFDVLDYPPARRSPTPATAPSSSTLGTSSSTRNISHRIFVATGNAKKSLRPRSGSREASRTTGRPQR